VDQPETPVNVAEQVAEMSETQAALATLFQHLEQLVHQRTGGDDKPGLLGEDMQGASRLARVPAELFQRDLSRHLSGNILKHVRDGFKQVQAMILLISTVEDRLSTLEDASDLNAVASPDELFGYLHDVNALCQACIPFMISDEHKALLGQVQTQTDEFLSRMSEEDEEPDEGEDEDEAGDEPAVEEEADDSSSAGAGKGGLDAEGA
jgi:hypothetical protein